jgi:two-component system, chemotaxis family, protein-glutamate methylesterase/glutaminase
MRPVRVLVVDDSATMRFLIATVLSRDPMIEVVGEVADPLQAREAVKAFNPDVMTLDVEMPKMDGLAFLEKVMRLRPFPVVMISGQTGRGAAAAISALELGAVSCVGKPTPERPDAFDDLPAIVKAAASAHLDRRSEHASSRAPEAGEYKPDGRIVAIGASTGGVEALVAIISRMPANCPPTLVTIHLPSPFTRSFAMRLDGLCEARVMEAEDGALVRPGEIYIAPGSVAHLEICGAGPPRCRLQKGEPINGHRPSVDALFHSVAKTCGANALGVILTGMGRDGAAGLLTMRQAGARTLGQNEATSVVYGMARAAYEIGAVERQSALSEIAAQILALTSKFQPRRTSHGARG